MCVCVCVTTDIRVVVYPSVTVTLPRSQRRQTNARIIDEKYRQLVLITQDEEGGYSIADELIKAYEEAKD